MQIRTIRKGFEAIQCKFEPFERDLKQWNGNSKDSKRIRIIRMQIWTTENGLEAFECKLKPFECKFEQFEWKFETFERDSKHFNSWPAEVVVINVY